MDAHTFEEKHAKRSDGGSITSKKSSGATPGVVAIQISFKALTHTNLVALVCMYHPPSAARLSRTSRIPGQTSAPYSATGFGIYVLQESEPVHL